MPDLRERWRTGWLEATAYDFGPGQNLAELETSLADAGLAHMTTSRNGALAYFSARRRGRITEGRR